MCLCVCVCVCLCVCVCVCVCVCCVCVSVSNARLFILPKGEEKSGKLPIPFWFAEFGIILRYVNGMLIFCCHVQCTCTCRFVYSFVLPALDAVKLSHDSAFLLVMCTSDALSCSIAKFDSKQSWRKQSFKSRLV